MKRSLVILGLSCLVGQTACVSMSSLQTAETLEKGKKQTTFGGGYYTSQETSNGTTVSTKLPYLEYSYREGLAKDFDAGLKLTIVGSLAADAKYRLYDGKDFDFSVGGGVGYMSLKTGSGNTETNNTIIDLMVPLYASYRFDDSWAVYLTPRYVLRMNNQSSTAPGATSSNSTASLFGGAGGVKIGKSWGAYLEAAYQKQSGSSFDLMQYNVSLFWESDGGVLSKMF